MGGVKNSAYSFWMVRHWRSRGSPAGPPPSHRQFTQEGNAAEVSDMLATTAHCQTAQMTPVNSTTPWNFLARDLHLHMGNRSCCRQEHY